MVYDTPLQTTRYSNDTAFQSQWLSMPSSCESMLYMYVIHTVHVQYAELNITVLEGSHRVTEKINSYTCIPASASAAVEYVHMKSSSGPNRYHRRGS